MLAYISSSFSELGLARWRAPRFASSSPRSSPWKQFLASHADQIFKMDFATHFLWDYTSS